MEYKPTLLPPPASTFQRILGTILGPLSPANTVFSPPTPIPLTYPTIHCIAQNMEYKFVELLSCRFFASSEEVVRAQVGA